MFTGLIKEQGRVVSIEKKAGGCRLAIQTPPHWNDLQVGESISSNGICLTLEACKEENMYFFVGLETLEKTNFQCWKLGEGINLERSLRMGDRLGGHLVSGHVDGVGLVESVEVEGSCLRIAVLIREIFKKWVVGKGSICVNGISLTVNEFDLASGRIELFIIPETLRVTNLSYLKVGDYVNLEFDQMVKVLAEKIYLMRECYA